MLKQRVITAAILLLLLAVVLFVMPYWMFDVSVCLVFTLAAWEWANMAGLTDEGERIRYTAGMAAALVVLSLLHVERAVWLPLLLAGAVAGWVWALRVMAQYPADRQWYRPALLRWLGYWLLLPAAAALLALQAHSPGGGAILYVILSIAVADIGAYFAGRRFGKAKLAVAISPGKTWAGLWGGMAANAVLAMAAAVHLSLSGWQFVGFLLVMLLTGLASVVGDLFESMVKRERGIKDSSDLLPGHGGVLDRIDGWTAALPLFTLCYLVAGV